MKRILFLLILFPTIAFAGQYDRSSEFFGGLGLTYGSSQLTPGGNTSTSTFASSGYLAQGGVSLMMSGSSGAEFSLELGQGQGVNSGSGASFVEIGATTFFAAKAGLFFGPITIGGGYRHDDLSISSMASGTGYTKTEYSGYVPLVYTNVSLDFAKRYRGAVELQYINGSLTSGTDKAKDVQFNVGLKVYILFN